MTPGTLKAAASSSSTSTPSNVGDRAITATRMPGSTMSIPNTSRTIDPRRRIDTRRPRSQQAELRRVLEFRRLRHQAATGRFQQFYERGPARRPDRVEHVHRARAAWMHRPATAVGRVDEQLPGSRAERAQGQMTWCVLLLE
jgi:hypothetical protein